MSRNWFTGQPPEGSYFRHMHFRHRDVLAFSGGGKYARRAYKPDFVQGAGAPLDDHSSWHPVARAPLAANPDRRAKTCLRVVSVARPSPACGPYLALLPVGLAVPSLLPGPRWSLTPPFHPYPILPQGGGHGRSVFCGAIPRVTPAGRYPAPLSCGVRTFLGAR